MTIEQNPAKNVKKDAALWALLELGAGDSKVVCDVVLSFTDHLVDLFGQDVIEFAEVFNIIPTAKRKNFPKRRGNINIYEFKTLPSQWIHLSTEKQQYYIEQSKKSAEPSAAMESKTHVLEEKHELKVEYSQENYINLAIGGDENDFRTVEGSVDKNAPPVEIGSKGSTAVLCSPSKEAFQCSSEGEDAGGITQRLDVSSGHQIITCVQADGVGQSFLAHNAARAAVEAVVSNGQLNLDHLDKVMRELHSKLEIPDDIDNEFLLYALEYKKKNSGSATMLNTITIDQQTGELDGMFIGDGGLSIFSLGGTSEKRYLTGNTAGSITTKTGVNTQHVTNLKDLTQQSNKTFLLTGDVVLLYSDGLLFRQNNEEKGRIEDIANLVKSGVRGNKLQDESAKIFQRSDEGDRDDDKVLIIYEHP
jgi:hypothetical protein